MSDLWPIYIPSYHRAGRVKFPGTAPAALVIHPEDEPAYRAAYPEHQVLVIPGETTGVHVARQWIKDHAEQAGRAWYWILDDDLSPYYTVQNNRAHRAPAEQVLSEVQAIAELDARIAAIGLEMQQLAWRSTQPLKVNTQLYSCVALHTERTRAARYRFPVVEDVDLCLQLITTGYWTVKAQWWAFATPEDGSKPGGMRDRYEAGIREAEAERLSAAWPGVLRFGPDRRGIPRARVAWRDFAPPKMEQDFAFAGRVPGWR